MGEVVKLGESISRFGATLRAQETKKIKRSKVNPGITAWHEAGHTTVAVVTNDATVEGVNIIRQGNVLGVTHVSRVTARIAGAGEAIGDPEGAGSDWMIVASRNEHWHDAVSGADSALHGNGGLLRAFASALEEYKSLSGNEVYDLKDAYESGIECMVSLRLKDGRLIEETARANFHTNEVAVSKSFLKLLTENDEGGVRIGEKKTEASLAPADLPKSDITTENDLRKAA